MQSRRVKYLVVGLATILSPVILAGRTAGSPPEVAIAEQGRPLLTIYAVSTGPETKLAVADLQQFLGRMAAGPFKLEAVERLPARTGPGVYVGTSAALVEMATPTDLGEEEFILRTRDGSQIVLAGGGDTGTSHAVYTLLGQLGCLWFFPGKVWEVVPSRPTVRLALDDRQKPDYDIQRRFSIGHGMHSPAIITDYAAWTRRNRMGNPLGAVTNHSWPFDPARHATDHPEWYALVNGTRPGVAKPGSGKPCCSHPGVIIAGINRAEQYFQSSPSAKMLTVSAPDGVGFCECPGCQKLAGVTQTFRDERGFLFGKKADGSVVSVASEAIFRYANEVARAVARKFPGKYVGILAYSGYSHPPSFDLEPNVYVELTSGFRSTPLSPAEQLATFARRAKNLGTYEYYDVEQWSWELPGKARAADLDYLATTIADHHRQHIGSLLAEVSNNWAPNGLGYYLAARLLWRTSDDARSIENDFYQQAFGPAAEPVRRFYHRWKKDQSLDHALLAQACADLKEAADRSAARPECRARVDCLRMYAHFLIHYVHPPENEKRVPHAVAVVEKKYGRAGAVKRIQYLGDYTRRLMDTHMVHSYAFNRYLTNFGQAYPELKCADWKRPGTPPTFAEIDRMFAEDLRELQKRP